MLTGRDFVLIFLTENSASFPCIHTAAIPIRLKNAE
jgi:hypothetical protein